MTQLQLAKEVTHNDSAVAANGSHLKLADRIKGCKLGKSELDFCLIHGHFSMIKRSCLSS